MSPSLAPFLLLPTEVMQAVFSALPDVWSLRCVALTCSSLYRAVIEAEAIIATQILLKEVHWDVLPEAIAAFVSSRLDLSAPDADSRIIAFTSAYLGTRRQQRHARKLSEAIQMSRLQRSVSYFTDRFANEMLDGRDSREPTSLGASEMTRTEVTRFERTLYRFEIYRNLFPKTKRTRDLTFDLDRQVEVFFSKFSPWENEQLACVHECLASAVSPAFDEIAEHDIAWGEFHVKYGGPCSSIYIQGVLALGLVKCHQTAIASSYEERHRLLYINHPDFRFDFLYEGLKNANKGKEGLFLGDFDKAADALYIQPPFAAEANSGPEDVWRWAHADDVCTQFVYSERHKSLRAWGYVMWDQARLEEWNVMAREYEEPEEELWTEEKKNEESQRFGEMMASWEARSRIFKAGGRGWFNVGDHSRIVWPNRIVPSKKRLLRPPVEVNSLEEAKTVINRFKF